MKKIGFILLLFFFSVWVSKAQNLIAVENNSTPSFFTSLDSAIVHAQNGDTVYIPGGAFAVNNNTITIDKELHLIGVGHNPDSTIATGMTKINAGAIYLVSGANSSSFEGFKLNGDLISGVNTSNEDVDNISITRCHFMGNIDLSRFSTNWSVTESIIDGSIEGSSQSGIQPLAQLNYFSNNIIGGGYIFFGPNNQFKNNIFLYQGYNIMNVVGCIFENNIFIGGLSNISSCTFNNNLYTGNFVIPSDCILSNNILVLSITAIFFNFSANTNFSYTENFHLLSTCPGKNAGRDGTDIGIYGGAFPWKEGSVPFNPHIQYQNISGSTNTNGNLNVNIKVAAQDH